jgi:hypothetical protein
MKVVIFKNKIFYSLLTAYLILLLIYNLYATLTGNLFGLIPVSIQIALIILILIKNKYAKLFIQIWVIVALFIGSGLEIIVELLQGFEDFKLTLLMYNLFQFGIGLLILDYTRRTVIVAFPDSNDDLNKDDASNFEKHFTPKA